MLLLTQGEAGVDCCDPFVNALQKRSSVNKYGPHIIICDLLVFAVKDGKLFNTTTATATCKNNNNFYYNMLSWLSVYSCPSVCDIFCDVTGIS